MSEIVVYDCEYLSKEGAMGRMWSGHDDPDPIVVQIGAVRLNLDDNAKIIEETKIFIRPKDRKGAVCGLDPYFIALTGITDETIAQDAVELGAALAQLDEFSGTANFWAWGKDELIALGISCFLAGIAPPIKPSRFGNLKSIFRQAGMPNTDIDATSSGEIADYYGVGNSSLSKHDALDDALSLSRALRYLMERDQVSPHNFEMIHPYHGT